VPLLVALLALVPAAGFADVQVAREIPYAKDAKVRQAVREKCEVGTRLALAIEASSPEVELVDRPSGRSRLDLEILRVHSPGGGVFSGPKWIEVKGKLRKGGRVVGDFVARRYSSGGPFGLFIGTCGILNRITKALGNDIGVYLESPSKGARIGDFRS